MGYFTFTDAIRPPKLRKDGFGYVGSCVIPYGGYAKVVCPDNTVLEEFCYEGYGEFAGRDIYDLVAEWNKDHLEEIFERLAAKSPYHWGHHLKKIALLYQNGRETEIPDAIQDLEEAGLNIVGPWLAEEWKREVGIAIAGGGEDNKDLPYPIKITTSTRSLPYKDLVASLVTQ